MEGLPPHGSRRPFSVVDRIEKWRNGTDKLEAEIRAELREAAADPGERLRAADARIVAAREQVTPSALLPAVELDGNVQDDSEGENDGRDRGRGQRSLHSQPDSQDSQDSDDN